MGKENQTHEGSYLVRDKKNTPIIMTSGRDKKIPLKLLKSMKLLKYMNVRKSMNGIKKIPQSC